jgi:hypothetical protein
MVLLTTGLSRNVQQLPQQAQALADESAYRRTLTASGKSSSEGLREILGFCILSHNIEMSTIRLS